jgi:anaerobic nitric oxide reductase transcription regulator
LPGQSAASSRLLAAGLRASLSVFPLFVPSLNERRDDIVLLAGYFCEQCRMKFGLMLSGGTGPPGIAPR